MDSEIRFIQQDDLLVIRNGVLRNGKLTLDECRWQSDDIPGTFHLGYFAGDKLLSIASFHPQVYGEFQGAGYQLRGMATIEEWRGQGIGNKLLNFGLTYLRGQGANYVWCNARKTALKFYRDMGFEVISDEFEVPVIGPHYVMYIKLQ
jgi:ribosomal protein S18 acetylase RimI-like enzyme